jgi:hypothetical protein
MGMDYAARARALVGTRFRPQGRDERGLDCVGLAIETYEIPAESVRRDYQLRGNHRAEIERGLKRYFRRVSKRDARCGDVMLLQVASEQLHLAVRTDVGFVHAHAGLRRVVETPGEPEWPLMGVYRKRTKKRSS